MSTPWRSESRWFGISFLILSRLMRQTNANPGTMTVFEELDCSVWMCWLRWFPVLMVIALAETNRKVVSDLGRENTFFCECWADCCHSSQGAANWKVFSWRGSPYGCSMHHHHYWRCTEIRPKSWKVSVKPQHSVLWLKMTKSFWKFPYYPCFCNIAGLEHLDKVNRLLWRWREHGGFVFAYFLLFCFSYFLPLLTWMLESWHILTFMIISTWLQLLSVCFCSWMLRDTRWIFEGVIHTL